MASVCSVVCGAFAHLSLVAAVLKQEESSEPLYYIRRESLFVSMQAHKGVVGKFIGLTVRTRCWMEEVFLGETGFRASTCTPGMMDGGGRLSVAAAAVMLLYANVCAGHAFTSL